MWGELSKRWIKWALDTVNMNQTQSRPRLVWDNALLETERAPPEARPRRVRRRASSAALAAKELDVSSMSLKEVIRWTNARERVLLAEERRLRVRCALEP